jgi:hypothetical protein
MLLDNPDLSELGLQNIGSWEEPFDRLSGPVVWLTRSVSSASSISSCTALIKAAISAASASTPSSFAADSEDTCAAVALLACPLDITASLVLIVAMPPTLRSNFSLSWMVDSFDRVRLYFPNK